MTDERDFEDVEGVEADPADVLEQAETPDGEPVADAIAGRERISAVDGEEDERLVRDADEAAGGAGV